LIARALSGGFNSAWPLALGVLVGDLIWPLLAILGVNWMVSEFSYFVTILRWVSVLMFLSMGVLLLINTQGSFIVDKRLTKPGVLAGFVAGLVVILGNPKAIFFYMAILPGFFNLSEISVLDIFLICLLSMLIPLAGNLFLAKFIESLRKTLTSPLYLSRLNRLSGLLLIGVGLLIFFSILL
ncbi:MAG: LysE family transporter, partial [Proteobacteria bacterium]|nr:LysE family transporter [Pseudomonadota bacterium]